MNYKRLTKRVEDYVFDNCCNCEYDDNPMGCTEHCCYEVMKKRLAELEDKIEQGTLIELPCKVGDTVWCIDECYDREKGSCRYYIFDNEVISIEICKHTFLILGSNAGYYCWNTHSFATREEAEKRLKELQNG